jgi:hypothetical protein
VNVGVPLGAGVAVTVLPLKGLGSLAGQALPFATRLGLPFRWDPADAHAKPCHVFAFGGLSGAVAQEAYRLLGPASPALGVLKRHGGDINN